MNETIIKKNGHEFEREQRGIYESFWREESEKIIIIIKIILTIKVKRQKCETFDENVIKPFHILL